MEILISEEESGQRIDRYLFKLLPNAKRTQIYKMIRKKDIRVNSKKVKENYMLGEGDRVYIYLTTDVFNKWKKKTFDLVDFSGLEIVYENQDILLVNKPTGVLSIVDSSGRKSITEIVQSYLSECITDTYSPSPISRLDYNTSGILLFAKRYSVARRLNELSRDRLIKKKYLAIVHGVIKEKMSLTFHLKKNEETNITKVDKYGKKSLTTVTPIIHNGKYTLVDVEIMTGRSHQIRASLAAISHALLNDKKYGSGDGKYILSSYYLSVGDDEYIYINDEVTRKIKEIFGVKKIRYDKGVIKLI